MGRRERQDGLIMLFPTRWKNERKYVLCRIRNNCGRYLHYDRESITEVDGVIVDREPLPDLHTLVRI